MLDLKEEVDHDINHKEGLVVVQSQGRLSTLISLARYVNNETTIIIHHPYNSFIMQAL